VERLASNHINVNYAYCTSGFTGGKAMGVFRVSDLHKAAQVLAERKPRRKAESALRRPCGTAEVALNRGAADSEGNGAPDGAADGAGCAAARAGTVQGTAGTPPAMAVTESLSPADFAAPQGVRRRAPRHVA